MHGKHVYVPATARWRRVLDYVIAIVLVSTVLYKISTTSNHRPPPRQSTTTAAPTTTRPVMTDPSVVQDTPLHPTSVFPGFQGMCNTIARYNASAIRARLERRRQPYVGRALSSAHDPLRKAGRISIQPDDEAVIARRKILCLMFAHNDEYPTNPGRHYNVWGKDCDDFVFIAPGDPANPKSVSGLSGSHVATLPIFGGNEAKNRWGKARTAINWYVDNRIRQFDWVILVSDDTTVIVDNMRLFLGEPTVAKAHDMGVPIYTGHRLVSSSVFISQGGFIFNSYAARLVATMMTTGLCNDALSENDDLELSDCMSKGGVLPLDSTDFADEDRLPIFGPTSLDSLPKMKSDDWYVGFRNRPMPTGFDVLSVVPIAFHYQEDSDRIYRDLERF